MNSIFKLARNFATKAPRNPEYGKLTPENVGFFQSFLKPNQILQEDLAKYNNDWMHLYKGNSEIVLFPKTSEEVSKILKYCNEQKLAVVPQSGNTGLVGGSVPVYDEIIMSLEKMNKLINFDEKTDILTVEGGIILEQVNEQLKKHNCEIPWDLGAKGSCTIGGNVATCAGGKYFVKYGSLRGHILGLEVVTGRGDLLDMQCSIRKDNTGMDLKQLFIGSEGYLGVITKVNVLCSRLDKLRNLLLINCSSYEEVLKIYSIAKSTLNRNLAAIEFMDSYSYRLVKDNLTHTTDPFENECELDKDYYVLLEINTNHEMEVLEEGLFEKVMELEGFKDCIKAQSEQQFTDIWEIRESVAEACTKAAQTQFKYDISLNINHMDEILYALRERTKDFDCQTVGYGHIGDSNLHINVVINNAEQKDAIGQAIEPFVFEYVQKLKGSISAEHGLGLQKPQYLSLQKSQETIGYMRDLKNVFDPNGILNPYKILPPQ